MYVSIKACHDCEKIMNNLSPFNLRAKLGTRNTGLSPPVIFTDRSKAVLLLWFIFICYDICNVCLLHDFEATLRLSALPSALYFILSKPAL